MQRLSILLTFLGYLFLISSSVYIAAAVYNHLFGPPQYVDDPGLSPYVTRFKHYSKDNRPFGVWFWAPWRMLRDLGWNWNGRNGDDG
jgi:hypothetical protein